MAHARTHARVRCRLRRKTPPRSDIKDPCMRFAIAHMICLLLTTIGLASAAPVDANGVRLERLLDRTEVETRWPAGVHVSWETGIPDGKAEHGDGKHTHCSAFVAAVAKQLGVYILRPPEHGQILLANAQYDWLSGDGTQQGWTALPDAAAA